MKKLFFCLLALSAIHLNAQKQMHLNDKGYLEYRGVNVMLAQDFYPEGHQGGVGVIQNGLRVATNGDLRLDATPGQWSPIPKVGGHSIDKATQTIRVQMHYPNEDMDRHGFNPIIYPDLHFSYSVRVVPVGKSFKIIIDLDSALPEAWYDKVGFNFELFPGALFGKSYYMDHTFGIFPRQANTQNYVDGAGETQVTPMAIGNMLTVAPEAALQTMTIENLNRNQLQLIDGRGKYNNGWFVVRSLVAKGKTKGAIEWLVTPNAVEGWMSKPVVQVSQIGYHPNQKKIAVIELDAHDKSKLNTSLLRINENGGYTNVLQSSPKDWGNFLRYHYLQFDFTQIKKPGMYVVKYGSDTSNVFQISARVYTENVWQPTLEYFLPAQMCHMRVNEKYRVWHGFCHMDDARMAPIDSNHFDGYMQGPSTLTKYKSGETVPGLNVGAWHDAGDFDLRVESQAETVYGLTLAYEAFGVKYDNTTINQQTHVVEIQQPDGKPDLLQQIEHGLLSIVGGYKSMGRFYRGIIEPTLQQYTILGDAASITDNKFYNDVKISDRTTQIGIPNAPDDRWVFTEDNPGRSVEVATALAAAYRVMTGFNDSLATDCLNIAESVWNDTKEKYPGQRIELATELYISTKNKKYSDFLIANKEVIAKQINNVGWVVGRALPMIDDAAFTQSIANAVQVLFDTIKTQSKETPYEVPYRPNIWGAGWDIQHFGYKQYFLHEAFPKIVSDDYMLAALNFILGCHPGSNTASFASGVGAHSMTVAYGFNRADWSYIPGGIASGTALIRPDFPELAKWPFFWQQGEYVLGGGTTDYLFLVLAANKVLSVTEDVSAANLDTIKSQMRYAAKQGLLDVYYPRNIDTLYGGYLSAFTYDFQPVGVQDKMIVTQARHTWSTAKAALFYHDTSYISLSAHGFYFLRDKMWDKQYGGFFNLVARDGTPKSILKEAYGNAFAIYGLSAYYECSHDTAALNLAKTAFRWLEKNSHNSIYKGYYQHLNRDGSHVIRTPDIETNSDIGYNDQNSSIHLLEALTELYKVWPDALVRERLQEMLELIRDKIVTSKGYLQMFFTQDWKPVSYHDMPDSIIMKNHSIDHVSFGHDVETAYLLQDADEVLNGKASANTLAVGKKMVDHALRNGWDHTVGGFYDEGYYFKNKPGLTITYKSKNWWAQAEALNTLLMFSDMYPNDPLHYRDLFYKEWQYVQTYLIDHEHGDWYEEGLDNSPEYKTKLKAQIWKGTYHNFRALMNCINRIY